MIYSLPNVCGYKAWWESVLSKSRPLNHGVWSIPTEGIGCFIIPIILKYNTDLFLLKVFNSVKLYVY